MAQVTKPQSPRPIVYIGESIAQMQGLAAPGVVIARNVDRATVASPESVEIVVHDVRDGEGRISDLALIRDRFPRAFLLAIMEARTPMKQKLEARDAGCDDFIMIVERADLLPALTRAAAYQARRYRILVVDDEKDIRDALAQELWESNFDVVTAADGRTGVSQAWDVDLVLLDIMMPGMDGRAVCKALRSNPKLIQLPIIVLSALDKMTSKVELLDLGANDYVTKPYDLHQLVGKIRRLVWARRSQDASRQAAEPRPRTGTIAPGARVSSRDNISTMLDQARTAWEDKRDARELKTTLMNIVRLIES